jgi:glycosyltransferase involved in cell wall biosynthesis
VRAVAQGHHDVVHLHSVETALVAPLLKVRYPVVATAHGSPRRTTRTKWGPLARVLVAMTERPFVRFPEVVTSVSAVDARYFKERYGRSVLYVPNGVDPPPPSTREEREAVCASFGVTPGRFALFAAGRLIPTKGCDVFLDALSRIPDAPPALVVGDLQQLPQYGEHLLAEAKMLPVLFAEPIRDRSRLMALLSSCAVFVFPSLAEGMSMMLLEAAACGVPLVCSDIPENSAMLGDRAIYFRSGDSTDLARKMDWVVEHHEEAQRIAIEAAHWVIETYAWDRIVPQYEEAYEMAVRRRST